MNKTVSTRCGRIICKFYDEHNKTSKCSKYDGRRKCPESIKQRGKSARHSRERQWMW